MRISESLRTELRELVIIDWLAEHAGTPGTWGLVGRSAATGELGPEVRGWIADLAASRGDVPGLENLDGPRGSLAYALGMVDVVLGALFGESSSEALHAFQRLTGRNLAARFRDLARRQGHPTENADDDARSVLFELIREIALAGAEDGHRPRYQRQAAALRQAADNTLSDHTGGKREPRRDHPGAEPPAEPPAAAAALSPEDRITLRLVIERAGLSDRESEAIQLRLQGLEGKGLAEALGVEPKGAETLTARAIAKMKAAV